MGLYLYFKILHLNRLLSDIRIITNKQLVISKSNILFKSGRSTLNLAVSENLNQATIMLAFLASLLLYPSTTPNKLT